MFRQFDLNAPMGSELPALLRQAGHRVIDYGKHERLMPVVEVMKEHGRAKAIKREQVGVGIVGVWQFDLPPVFAANAETRTCAGI